MKVPEGILGHEKVSPGTVYQYALLDKTTYVFLREYTTLKLIKFSEMIHKLSSALLNYLGVVLLPRGERINKNKKFTVEECLGNSEKRDIHMEEPDGYDVLVKWGNRSKRRKRGIELQGYKNGGKIR